MGSGQWPGLMVSRKVTDTWCIKGMSMQGIALWKFEGCVTVGHVSAHQNSLPGLEGEWNKQADTPRGPLEVATWVHEMSGHGGPAAMQRWAASRPIPLCIFCDTKCQ